MVRVVLAAIPMPGHLIPLLPIGRHLVENGYDVTVLTSEALEPLAGDIVNSPRGRLHPLRGKAAFDGNRILAEFPVVKDTPAGYRQVIVAPQEMFIPPIPEQFRAVQEVLEAGDPATTVVIHEGFFHGTWPLLLGAPGLRPAGTIGLGVSVLTLEDPRLPPFGFGAAPDLSAPGERRARDLRDRLHREFEPVQKQLDDVLAGLGAVDRAPYYWDSFSLLCDTFFQLSPPGLEYERGSLPEHVELIGRPGSPATAHFDAPPWWNDVVTADRVVFVTQGTLNNENHGALIGPALEALADSDALVVATFGGRPVPPDLVVPANARVISYLPYDMIFPHTSVLVTNGGFGGVQAALMAGIPLVVAGDTEDKPEVAMRVEHAGAGINLRTGLPGVPAVRQAVERVLRDPSFRSRAEGIRDEYRARDPLARIKDEVDRMASSPRAGRRQAGHGISGVLGLPGR
ncbi:glycosyltransferase [Amycolatopsis sp. Hca4]|uniref:nucleotide disphospho-sugar-binding domain-containing protein n=1 Tax=Amycolatopsis sp. Hca4 TaxID=2742131 RepID=UPI001591F2DD|nr:glycosyltransferase [Amycolatopsis sp. Hca4]QKV74051.1 glycosyltransferase family 1 protein [Amycolatopsis sp. Hca4]